MSKDAIRLHPDDDVAVALRPLASGETIHLDGRSLTVRADIPMAHKLALHAIAAGDPVRKYGEAIGEARAAIAAGDHVHVHNLVSRRARKSA
jgi:altronate hydrolase